MRDCTATALRLRGAGYAYLRAADPAVTRVAEAGRGRGRLLYESCTDVAHFAAVATSAQAVAARLQSAAERVDIGPSIGISNAQATRAIALRETPAQTGRWLASVPPGAALVAFDGTLDGAESRRGGAGTWSRVALSDARVGWVAGRYVAALGLPRAPLPTMLGALPAPLRAAASTDAIVGAVRGARGNAPLWFVIAGTPEPAVYVGLSGPGAPGPGPAAPTAYARAAGTYDDVRFVRQPRATGAYVLLATQVPGLARGVVRWQLFAPGAATSGWTFDAPTSELLPEAEQARLATNVRSGSQTWIAELRMPGQGGVVRVRDVGGRFVEARSTR